MQSFDLELFADSGDLAMRRLPPALYRRYLAGQKPVATRLLGMARGALSPKAWIALARESCGRSRSGGIDTAQWARFADSLHYLSADASRPDSFGALAALLAGRDGFSGNGEL
jgi:glucose-6-phosphate 1-dehydrogenase